MARKRLPPFELEIDRLGRKGTGVGVQHGRTFQVRGAPPGSRVLIMPAGKRKGIWNARRLHMVRPPADYAEPPCAVFGLCGGCVLQELSLPAQRRAKEHFALAQVAEPLGLDVDALREQVRVHPIRGTEAAYGYRNKIELSFGTARYLTEADHRAGMAIDGRFLGFHAPGRFDRVVDAETCWLVDPSMREVVTALRDAALVEGPPNWNAKEQTGFWRHAMLRQSHASGEILVVLFTTTPPDDEAEAAVASVAGALRALSQVVGVMWLINDGVADVARGAVRQVWGQDWIEEGLGPVRYKLSATSFFQTNTAAAELLYDTVGEALDGRCETLLDLYCGIGSIGLYLANRADQVVGVEEVAAAVADARENALRNGLNATYHHQRAEDALQAITGGSQTAIVVDPPRVGLHPKVAGKIAETSAKGLVYVACNPASLGRDAVLMAPGWRLTDLWTVDLFPQTGHIEMVGRFVPVSG